MCGCLLTRANFPAAVLAWKASLRHGLTEFCKMCLCIPAVLRVEAQDCVVFGDIKFGPGLCHL